MSKGLEALKQFRNSNFQGVNVYADEYLDIIEKELKALEIIKKELNLNVKVFEDNYCLFADNFGWVISKEEYDLLIEVLL